MKLSRLKVELIVTILVIAICLSGWWFIFTKDQRKVATEYKQLVRIANRQAIEIVIIEQAEKLTNYRQQMIKNQRQAKQKSEQELTKLPKG